MSRSQKRSSSLGSSVKAEAGSTRRTSLASQRPALPPALPSSLRERAAADEGHYETPPSQVGSVRGTTHRSSSVRNSSRPSVVNTPPADRASVRKSRRSAPWESGKEEIYIHSSTTVDEEKKKRQPDQHHIVNEYPETRISKKKSSRRSSKSHYEGVPSDVQSPELYSDNEDNLLHPIEEERRSERSRKSKRSSKKSHYDTSPAIRESSRAASPSSHAQRAGRSSDNRSHYDKKQSSSANSGRSRFVANDERTLAQELPRHHLTLILLLTGV